MAYGYVLSKQRIRIIALHDCDIVISAIPNILDLIEDAVEKDNS